MISATHLHAIVIHFPIALLVIGFISEITSVFYKKDFLKNVAFYLLLLGAIGVIIAYFSGSYAGEGIEEGPLKTPMKLHENAALVTLFFAVITSLLKVSLFYFKYHNIWTNRLYILLFTALTVAVLYTGYLGGQLVYSHGAGVELALPVFNN